MRLIDADELLKKAEYIPTGLKSRGMCVGFHGVTVGIIENAHTIGPESLQPHGRWIRIKHNSEQVGYECSCCGSKWPYVQFFAYCPYCGAKMEYTNEN